MRLHQWVWEKCALVAVVPETDHLWVDFILQLQQMHKNNILTKGRRGVGRGQGGPANNNMARKGPAKRKGQQFSKSHS